MKTLLSLLAIICIITGCASAGKNYDSRKVTEIKKGETTEADLLKMFGKPNNRGIDSETGTTLMWIYSEARMGFTTVTTKTKTLTVSLDQAGKVASYNYSGGGFETSNSVGRDPEDGPAPKTPTAGKRQ